MIRSDLHETERIRAEQFLRDVRFVQGVVKHRLVIVDVFDVYPHFGVVFVERVRRRQYQFVLACVHAKTRSQTKNTKTKNKNTLR